MNKIIVKITNKIKERKERKTELKKLAKEAGIQPFYKRGVFVTVSLSAFLCTSMIIIDTLEKRFDMMKDAQATLNARIDELENIVNIAQTETKTYKYLYEDINVEVASVKSTNKNLESKVKSLEKTISASKKYDANNYSRGALPEKDLTKYSLISIEEMNEWIVQRAPKNSPFIGKGEMFLKASKESGLDPKYLVAHAALESTWGTSKIAIDKNNMFGIGAFNSDPYNKAYSFDSFEEGVIKGAIWIRDNYANKGQNTLSSMIYGPRAYCVTDEGKPSQSWIDKIVSIIL